MSLAYAGGGLLAVSSVIRGRFISLDIGLCTEVAVVFRLIFLLSGSWDFCVFLLFRRDPIENPPSMSCATEVSGVANGVDGVKEIVEVTVTNVEIEVSVAKESNGVNNGVNEVNGVSGIDAGEKAMHRKKIVVVGLGMVAISFM